MTRIPGYQLAAAALMTVAVLLSVACVQRLTHVPDFGRVASSARMDVVPKVVQGPPGSLQVAIPFPALATNRRPQYAYDSGFVYSVELHLYDSQGNYQNYLVVRNTELAAGLAAGTASVTFTNVPPGPCTLSVHTSQKQLYGAAGSSAVIRPRIAAGNTTFDVTGVVGDVFSRFSDSSSPFLVFRSNDINNGAGANGAPTSALFSKEFFQARNGLEKEHLDTTTVTAGYGTGAATATITPAATITINVTVTQPPAWSTTLYQTSPIEIATVSAGATLSAVPSATALVSGPNN
ncbi:MAG: hypothetical protein FJZ00_08470, partial [Candidatus Sericytochromatia bacterium]|nr:hypothetical protein [Candidatus Tanganyikabacteria bacterium]